MGWLIVGFSTFALGSFFGGASLLSKKYKTFFQDIGTGLIFVSMFCLMVIILAIG